VLRRRDPDLIDNLPPARLTGASEPQKLELLGLLANQGWAGDEDEGLMRTIWGSFGDPVAVADTHIDLWRLCVARGADLESLPAVQTARTDFERDVKAVVHHHLAANRRYVQQEMARFGIQPEGQAAAPMTADQRTQMQQLQELAVEIRRAQEVRDQVQQVVVGYDLIPEARPGLIGSATTTPQQHADDVVARRGRGMVQPTTFDPFRPPHHAPFGDEQPPMASYERVKAYDDEMAQYLAGFAANSPAMFALIRDGRVGEVGAQGASPEQAQAVVRQVLQGTLRNITETEPKVDSGDLDWRDLTPIHDQLRGGASAGAAHQWNGPFRSWVIDDLLEGYHARQFWIGLGLGSLAAAAFIVAELATAGSATFFIAAGIGLGITAEQAASSWENYEDLHAAANTTMSRETEMVTQGQASAAMVKAAVDTVFAFLAAVGIGTRVVRALGGAGAALEGEEALLAAARGRASGRIAYMERRIANVLARREPRETVAETAAAELEQIHQGALRDVATIRNGGLPEFEALSPEARAQVADDYLEQVGRAWRDAQQRVARAAEAAGQPQVVPPDPSAAPGAPSPGFGHPPARRPPSSHHGTGWEDW
jgi:hypothetical protein